MKYSYEDIVNDLNEGKIESILFSIKDYPHYKNCKISAFFDTNQIFLILCRLVEDDSETVSFYKSLKTTTSFSSLEEKARVR